MSRALPPVPFDYLDTYPVAEIPAATTLRALLAAARCVPSDACMIEIPFPTVPVGDVAAHTVDLLETEIDEPLSLEEFRQSLAKAGRRPSGALSVLQILSDLEVYNRRWPPVLCFLEDDRCPLLEFNPLSGTIFVSPVDVTEGIDGHYLLFCLSNETRQEGP